MVAMRSYAHAGNISGSSPFHAHPRTPSIVQAAKFAPFSELLHGISTRHGGISTGPYRSLNLSFDVGDEYDRVRYNYRNLSRLITCDLSSMVACQQVHQNAIAHIDESYLERSCFLPEKVVPATDGLATRVPGITLVTRHADCVPLLFFNRRRQAVAIAHAGWKGTLARIGAAMMDFLSAHFNCRPEQTLAAIGPSVGPCCYEISSTMADLAEKKLPPGEQCIIASPDSRLTFDLWQANMNQLIASGIQKRHIVSSGICTACHTDLFFSYRKEGKVTGRFGAFIGLKLREVV